ncbi:hypothetical protein KI387_036211, partial [Taxus chinensis]
MFPRQIKNDEDCGVSLAHTNPPNNTSLSIHRSNELTEMAWAAAAAVSSFRPPTLSLPLLNLKRSYSVRKVQAPRIRFGVVAAQQTDIFKVLGTIWKTSKNVLDAGSKLVPESVPRPVARVGVAIGGFVAISFILKSVLSTALFIL